MYGYTNGSKHCLRRYSTPIPQTLSKRVHRDMYIYIYIFVFI